MRKEVTCDVHEGMQALGRCRQQLQDDVGLIVEHSIWVIRMIRFMGTIRVLLHMMVSCKVNNGTRVSCVVFLLP